MKLWIFQIDGFTGHNSAPLIESLIRELVVAFLPRPDYHVRDPRDASIAREVKKTYKESSLKS
jgi:hypothetical protein